MSRTQGFKIAFGGDESSSPKSGTTSGQFGSHRVHAFIASASELGLRLETSLIAVVVLAAKSVLGDLHLCIVSRCLRKFG